MAIAYGSAVVLFVIALLPLVCSGFPVALTLERAFPVNLPVNLTELIHRDRARHGRLLQSPKGVIDIPLAGIYDPFKLGVYYTKLQLGTPPRDFHVIVDTGSHISWVSCNSCTSCPKMSGLRNVSLSAYDPAISSSSSFVNCVDNKCKFGDRKSDSVCSIEDNHCHYSIHYQDGSETTGYYMKDLLNYESILPSSTKMSSTAPIIFGCSTEETTLMKTNRELDGIFGFGQQTLSLISQLASQGSSPRAFSHCLSGDENGGGSLVLGEIVEPNIVYSRLVPKQTHYNIKLEFISVNGQIIQINPSVFVASRNKGATIDSGTSLAYLPSEAYNALINAIDATVSSYAEITPYFDLYCYHINSSVNNVFPQVSLNFEGGAAIILGPDDYLLQYGSFEGGDARWCMGFDTLDGVTILGGSAAVNVSTVVNSTGMSKPSDATSLIDADTQTESTQGRVGPVTRSRAKRIKEDMSNLVAQAVRQEEHVIGIPAHDEELVLLIQATQE